MEGKHVHPYDVLILKRLIRALVYRTESSAMTRPAVTAAPPYSKPLLVLDISNDVYTLHDLSETS